MQHRLQFVLTTAVGIVIVAASAGAQARPDRPGRGTSQDRDFRAEQIDRQTRTIALGPSGLLELRNLLGDISVTAGSGRDVTVEIVRRSRGRTEADAKLGLERVTVAVDHQGERATVSAVYPEVTRAPYGVSVGYNVTAPAGTRVSVSSVSGDAVIKGITGDLSVQITSGDISVSGGSQVSNVRAISGDITLTDITSKGAIVVGSMSGDVRMHRVKAPRVTADVTSGDVIAQEMGVESAQLKSLSGDIEYAGTLVRGGRYELQSHSGDVRLFVSGGTGFELQASTFNGSITPQGTEVRNVSSTRRSYRGTVGDGAAVVAITTFNGDVVIGRK